jgi:non-ribosomal peptide synthetase-like protein
MPADPAADGLADWPEDRPRSRRHPGWLLAFAAAGAMVGMLPLLAVVPGLLLVGRAAAGAASPAGAVVPVLGATALGVLAALLLYAALVVAAIRLLALRLRPGCHPVRSWPGVRAWTIERLSDCATAALFPLYASVLTPAWLRALGARVGRGAEISTVTGLPSMMRVKGGSFLADDTLVAPYELRGGWMRIARATVGARAFLGNSGMTAPGHKVPKRGLVAVLSAAPRTSRKGSSWLGSPPAPIPRAQLEVDGTRTYRPGVGMILARGTVELLRVLPVLVAGLLAAGALLTLQAVVLAEGWALAAAAGGPVLVAAGAVAGAVTACAKWLLVGRYRVGEHPLWSAAVWRGELADTFTEVLAAPFLAGPAAGSPALVWWLRAMGARIGRGVWCETYWLPEPDLVRVGDAAGIGPGCVLQTHLFHDRLMSLDRVTLGHGATVGANSVVLPGASLGPGCAVGPGSLVLRGEQLPPGRWSGNPVAAWPVEPTTVSARPVEPTAIAARPVEPAPTQP